MQESDTVNQNVPLNEATKVLEKKAEKPNITPIQPPPKELDEKQKYALKSAYKFPNDPTILVHPHPKAKSGKFDCTVMSLSVLLDYRTEDNKESTFEVSLFAELFNEMLMRDSGFKLYKALVNASEKPSVEQNDKNKDTTNSEASEETKNEENSEDNTEKSKKKVITKDKDLLLACSYFDLGHCGYFETKDLEDILTTMNLNLSRAQIKKLLTKVTTGKDQQVNYRQFTDKAEDEDLVSYLETDDETLGQGFKGYLSSNESGASSGVTQISDGICNFRGELEISRKNF